MKIQPPDFPEPLKDCYDFKEVLNESIEDEEDIINARFINIPSEAYHAYKLEFHHCVFDKCDLMSSGLQRSYFADVIFSHCNLSNVILTDCTFHRVVFDHCKLLGADFNASIFENCHFHDCVGKFINVSSSKLKHLSFDHCDLSSGSFQECKLKNTCFEACNLSQVDFLHTSLKGIDLTSNTLHGLSLTGALELRGAVVNLFQAAELAKLLGVIIKD